MSATATQSAIGRYHEIRALQTQYLDAAEQWPEGSTQRAEYFAAFDELQEEKESLKRAAANRELADPERVAVHEAGHAVALKARGFNATSLTIVPSILSDGTCGLPDHIDATSKAVVSLAGAAAERSIYGCERFGGDEHDQANAAKMAGPQGYWLNDAARDEARAIVGRNTGAIRALAAALLKQRTMDAQQVYDALSRHNVR